MNAADTPREEASMPYQPEDDEPKANDALTRALHAAERTLLGKSGVTGVGMGQNETGEDAVVVYVRSAQNKRMIPASIRGVPVVVEISGDIEPLRGE
ncbi:MAG: hypothetical protein AB7I19_18410 [Planctomycetota bacterium]